MGGITSGGYAFSRACEFGIGFISAGGLANCIFATHDVLPTSPRFRDVYIVLLKQPDSRTFRAAFLRIMDLTWLGL